jgi:apolipoprotein N-acyltransferase
MGVRRPYLGIWIAGFVFWLLAVHWLRLPHPATSIGWVALSFYLAFYLPAFVGLTRIACHQWKIPVVLAAPAVWTGLELLRAHLLSGFTMASLSHTQFRWIALIQVSDLGGAYAVSFVVMLTSAAIARSLPCDGRPFTWRPMIPAIALVGMVLAYGAFRLCASTPRPGPVVALIQGSIDSEFKADPTKANQVFRQYRDLTRQALALGGVDVVVWPETMYRDTLVEAEPGAQPPDGADYTAEDLARAAVFSRIRLRDQLGRMAAQAPMIVGVDVLAHEDRRVEHFNSAVLVDRSGNLAGRYDKMHPVPFGEYVPFAKQFPWLYDLTPLGGGIEAGASEQAFNVDGVRFCPSVCFETLVPHLIRRQVASLARRQEAPHILVNLTNDGWFWGSSELDMHLAGGVFRAVECRLPLLIAANTGFSAHVDADGRVVKQGPRRALGVIMASTSLDRRKSAYLMVGDLFSGTCLASCSMLALLGIWKRIGTGARRER